MNDIFKQLNDWENIQSVFNAFEEECIRKQKIEWEPLVPKETVLSLIANCKKTTANKDFLLTLISGECAFFAAVLENWLLKHGINNELLAAKSEEGKVIHYFLKVSDEFGERYIDGSGAYNTPEEILDRYATATKEISKVCQETNEQEYEAFTNSFIWAIDMCDVETLIIEDEEQMCSVNAFNKTEAFHYCEVFDIFSIYLAEVVFKEN